MVKELKRQGVKGGNKGGRSKAASGVTKQKGKVVNVKSVQAWRPRDTQ